MFMRRNRAKNGTEQPESVARADSPAQASQGVLSSNPADLGMPEKRTFQPKYETPEAINRRHYRGGLDEGEGPDYEQYVPMGPKMC